MKAIKLILILVGMLTFSNVKAQQDLVVHVTRTITYTDGEVDEIYPVDFWLTMGQYELDIPSIGYKIVLTKCNWDKKPMEKGGTITIWDAILIDDKSNKLPIIFSIMNYEDVAYLIVDFLDGTQVYYVTDKFY